MKKKLLGEILVEQGVVNEAQVQEALQYAEQNNCRIGEALVALKRITSDQLAQALAEQFEVPYIDLRIQKFDPELAKVVPRAIAEEHNVVPLSQTDGLLTVAMTDPLDLNTLDSLRFQLNKEVNYKLASLDAMKEAIIILYGADETERKMMEEMAQTELKELVGDEAAAGAAEGADSAPVIKLVQTMILEAIRSRASDIHVEPQANRLRIRYRVDGVCYEVDSVPKRLQNSIVTRLKIMAKLKVDEKRRPQDGRIKLSAFQRDIDFRVSELPATYGPSIVLRILDRAVLLIGVSELGFHESDIRRFERIIKRPNGLFLVTGPTGSGKTTTLYATLNELNRPDKKIITAEDPVEYNISGINQSQVKEDIDVTFASLLRSMLRQSPDVILVGEIRDSETARVAMQAALTGHLVFSTLHTNDAPSAITRLIDLGVEPFLVASGVQAVMAQRLVRKLCRKCKKPYQHTDAELGMVGLRPDDVKDKVIYGPAGCVACRNTGYKGRIGIFELMEMNPVLQDMAYHKAPEDEVRREARASGMVSLQEDGARKILSGITSLEEVAAQTHEYEEE